MNNALRSKVNFGIWLENVMPKKYDNDKTFIKTVKLCHGTKAMADLTNKK